MDFKLKQELLNYLLEYISENKRNKIERISQNRTRYLTVVLEDIKEPKDASAVIRTCECFGIQELNIIENNTKYRINPDVVMGASKWIDIHQYKRPEFNNTEECINKLKKCGYRIVALTSSKNTVLTEELDIGQKSALLFGSEENGLSDYAIKNSDLSAKIPMYGFTESYNLSVSVAITVHNLVTKLAVSSCNWKLSNEEILNLKLRWIKKVIKKAENLEKLFLKENSV